MGNLSKAKYASHSKSYPIVGELASSPMEGTEEASALFYIDRNKKLSLTFFNL